MTYRFVFFLALLGIAAGLISAYIYGFKKKPLPPLFSPARNPYVKGLYTTGIIESYQPNGENINIFPEVSGRVTRINVVDGQTVKTGMALLHIEDSVQRAIAAQQKALAAGALAILEELKAEPRPETLAVSKAQVDLAAANLRTSHYDFEKVRRSFSLDPKSVSTQQLDDAENAFKAAGTSLELARKQYELTLAGAWIYDIRNQQRQYESLLKAYASAEALLRKYTIRAPIDGVVIAVKAAVGAYVSPQGAYGTYTEGYNPVFVMRSSAPCCQVRCYIDEILIPRLPPESKMKAQMFVRGTSVSIPLQFVRTQPYVVPKIELSNQRTERVDVRVLPIVFRFTPPQNMKVYAGQLVDVYVEGKE